MLEHTADRSRQRPGLPSQKSLNTAFYGQQGEVGQTAAAVEAEELTAVDCDVDHVCNTPRPQKNER